MTLEFVGGELGVKLMEKTIFDKMIKEINKWFKKKMSKF